MERRIDPDAPLDYVELQIFPSHNRYEACVSTSNTVEKVASGDLQELLMHLPQVKDLSSKTSNSNFKILAPEDVNDTDWFTTTTLRRFLLLVGSPDILTIGNEISQLEETRKFQLTLFAKAEVDMTSSFESKNELLRTVDLRLSELKEKLANSLNKATGFKCSPKDISKIENLAHHFGAEDIRDSLQKLLEVSQLKDSTTERNNHIPTSQTQLSPPVKYGVSPAKAAQMERQLSTDSESETSFSSEEDDEEEEDNQPPPIERSRTPARSAASRRSASPMRRIQIGRGGPRRPAGLNIKSLNYPKSLTTQRDEDIEEDEIESERLTKLRTSVKDKISLFESKKKEDEGVEIQKPKIVEKAVLRRWSSGMSQTREQPSPSSSPPPVSPKDAEKTKSPSPETVADVAVESNEKDVTSWSEQKEAELNQLFNKMMETKPVRRHSVTNANSKSKIKSSSEQRGGFYENYKQKRDEKLRKEVGKRAEKEAQLQEMQQSLNNKKAEIVSSNNKPKPSSIVKKVTNKPSPKKEAPKASSVVKKITNKPSQLPATRKSWPSAPSPKPTVTSTPPPPPQPTTTTTTRKPQSIRPNPVSKIEKSKPQLKTSKVITPQPETKTTRTKAVIEKKPTTMVKSAPAVKPKTRIKVDSPVTSTTAAATTTTAKPSFYKKVTKKSSVVPMETKPFLRKGTGIGPGGGAVIAKSKVAAQILNLENPSEEDEVDPVVVIVAETTESEFEPPPKSDLREEIETCNEIDDVAEEDPEPETCGNEFDVNGGDEKMEKVVVVEEELMISPSAWVEREEEDRDHEIVVCEERDVQSSSANVGVPGGVTSPRVRHSLFQMLLEETGEGESGEWGNAQNPHPVQKDAHAPKGFKRLLKFARKTKADLLLADGSSPSSIFRRG